MVTKRNSRKSRTISPAVLGKPKGLIQIARAGSRTGAVRHRRGRLRQGTLEVDALRLLRQGARFRRPSSNISAARWNSPPCNSAKRSSDMA